MREIWRNFEKTWRELQKICETFEEILENLLDARKKSCFVKMILQQFLKNFEKDDDIFRKILEKYFE